MPMDSADSASEANFKVP